MFKINVPNTNISIIFGPKTEKVTKGCRKTGNRHIKTCSIRQILRGWTNSRV